MGAQAQPLTVTVSNDGQHWHVRVWYDTYPEEPGTACVMVFESTLSCVDVPITTDHHNLWVSVALILEDFAEGVGLPVDGE